MSAAGLSIAMPGAANSWPSSRTVDVGPIPPALVKREAAPRRAKIWDFSTNLHCSIIGTCLSTGELRQVLRKFGLATADCSDHDLHRTAVTLAARHDEPARQLHKALDRRHKLTVSRFDKAGTEVAVRALWRDAVQRGDIPGAYWATLTHPLTNQAIVREAFGEVHMLSHLVGSANRADIRRLCLLEADKAALEAKLERQQQALHEAVVSRDAQIRELRQALTQRIVSEALPEDSSALRDLIVDLERRLVAETRRRAAAEDRLSVAQAEDVRTVRPGQSGTRWRRGAAGTGRHRGFIAAGDGHRRSLRREGGGPVGWTCGAVCWRPAEPGCPDAGGHRTIGCGIFAS